VERASPADLAMRAMGRHGPVRQQLGGVLVLDTGADAVAVGRVVGARLGGIPRLRQRLVRVPPGAGRPVWVDDPAFAPERHVRQRRCPPPGTERALLDLTAALLTEPLPADRPAWAATVVPGLAGGRTGVVLCFDHVLLDGIGGLAVLGRLVDDAPPAPAVAAGGARRPGYRELVADAWRSRWRAVGRAPAALRSLRRALAAGGGVRPHPVAACSLLGRTGPGRRLAVVTADLAALRAAAHPHGGTVNDAVLVAVSGALADLLRGRGEQIDPIVVTVMVTGRRATGADRLGNAATPLVTAVPSSGPAGDRLRRFAGTVRALRDRATGPPAIALLGPPFRLLAALGVHRVLMRRQRRFHTLVSNLAGPPAPVSLAGLPVRALVPVAVGETGNVTVSFVVLSYAGTLTVTVVADTDAVPDLAELTVALRAQLDEVCADVARLSGSAARPAW
jgi:WS/DGAT/MGAT family acyltransferase